MKRIALTLALAAAATMLPAGPSPAGVGTDDVYRSQLTASDRNGRPFVIEAVVEDRAGAAQLVVAIGRRCRSCRSDVYAKTLEAGELTVQRETMGAECQCFSAVVETKFGGVPLRIEWVWDPEQGGGPEGGGFEWTAVTVNDLLNTSCFGTGSHASTPNLSSSAPVPPKGAKKFPAKVPSGFRADAVSAPGCHTEGP